MCVCLCVCGGGGGEREGGGEGERERERQMERGRERERERETERKRETERQRDREQGYDTTWVEQRNGCITRTASGLAVSLPSNGFGFKQAVQKESMGISLCAMRDQTGVDLTVWRVPGA